MFQHYLVFNSKKRTLEHPYPDMNKEEWTRVCDLFVSEEFQLRILMEALCLNSFSFAPTKVARVSHSRDRYSVLHRGNSREFNKGSGNATKSCYRTFPISPERCGFNRSKHSTVAPVNAGSLHLFDEGRIQGDSTVKDVVIPNGTGSTASSTLAQMNEGIGVLNFFRGKNLLITGATGFLAKAIVEKIVREVPDVGKIFLLIKAKSEEAAMERLKSELINTELFNSLQQIHGEAYQDYILSKLVPGVGNVRDPDLAIDADVAQEIRNEVNVVVNSAATTDFRERKINGKATFNTSMHTATENLGHENAPSSSPILDIKGEMKLALDAKEALKDEISTQIKMRELGLERARNYGWQDTYVFTKAMGEMLIEETKGDIPVVIIRPSIIESAYKEPFPGWIEGKARMMDPIILSYGKGELTCFLADSNGILDLETDMVVNATLAAIARHGTAGKGDVNIYHVASSIANPLVLQDLVTFFHEHYISYPLIDAKGRPFRIPTMKLFTSKEEFRAHLSEDVRRRTGFTTATAGNEKLHLQIERIRNKAIEKANHLIDLYEPYCFYAARFDNSNTQTLKKSMSAEEQRMFGFDVRSIDWKDYIVNVHIPGLRKQFLK
ncbi:Fatty acyl-CoA reductase 2 [Morella rubra]|uniref:Fatty acyl-CoA reductase n=1 Tax=Morella rubra TaxID=262757 RepID=A0A6A1WF61_9ROSI|nr:Fatty acyl-CoA reductase 2 [Morella rubra]